MWADRVLHTEQPNPVLERPFTMRIENLKASHVLDLLAHELKIGYDMDTCGETPVSIVGKKIPLHTLLESLENQTEATIRLGNNQLSLRCETDELRIYTLDYLSIARSMNDSSSLSSAIAGGNSSVQDNRKDQGNRSELLLNNTQNHDVWESITQHIEQLIQSQPKPQEFISKERVSDEERDRAMETSAAYRRYGIRPPQRSASQSTANRHEIETTRKEFRSGRVVANPESGTVAVLATPKQHKRLVQWLSQVQRRLERQIVIEAVITEITLNERYERGIDWNILRSQGTSAGLVVQGLNQTNPALVFNLAKTASNTEASVVLRLLEEFGKTSVLSSPRVVAMNQQASVLKVIDNRVYFTTDVQTSAPTQNSPAFSTFTTQVHTVPVGFLMTVTPQIADNNAIQLRVRPTLSRIVGFVQDPNPALKQLNISSQVPEIQTRELESILRLRNGEMALLGGLRQKEQQWLDRGIPGSPEALSPLTDSNRRSENHIELVVLLKANVLDTPAAFDTPTELQNDPVHAPKALEQALSEGLAFAQNKQLPQALRLMELTQNRYPNAPEVAYNKALVLHLQGQTQQALSALQHAEKLCQTVQCTLPVLTLRTLLEVQE